MAWNALAVTLSLALTTLVLRRFAPASQRSSPETVPSARAVAPSELLPATTARTSGQQEEQRYAVNDARQQYYELLSGSPSDEFRVMQLPYMLVLPSVGEHLRSGVAREHAARMQKRVLQDEQDEQRIVDIQTDRKQLVGMSEEELTGRVKARFRKER